MSFSIIWNVNLSINLIKIECQIYILCTSEETHIPTTFIWQRALAYWPITFCFHSTFLSILATLRYDVNNDEIGYDGDGGGECCEYIYCKSTKRRKYSMPWWIQVTVWWFCLLSCCYAWQCISTFLLFTILLWILRHT